MGEWIHPKVYLRLEDGVEPGKSSKFASLLNPDSGVVRVSLVPWTLNHATALQRVNPAPQLSQPAPLLRTYAGWFHLQADESHPKAAVFLEDSDVGLLQLPVTSLHLAGLPESDRALHERHIAAVAWAARHWIGPDAERVELKLRAKRESPTLARFRLTDWARHYESIEPPQP